VPSTRTSNEFRCSGANIPAWYKWAATGTKITGHTTFLQHEQPPLTERTAEVYDPGDSSWNASLEFQPLSGGDSAVSMLTPGHSTPAGRVFGMGVDNNAYYLDVASSGSGSTGWTAYSERNSWLRLRSDGDVPAGIDHGPRAASTVRIASSAAR